MQANSLSPFWGKLSDFIYFISNILKKVLVLDFGFFVMLCLRECGVPQLLALLQMEETEVLSCGFKVSPFL